MLGKETMLKSFYWHLWSHNFDYTWNFPSPLFMDHIKVRVPLADTSIQSEKWTQKKENPQDKLQFKGGESSTYEIKFIHIEHSNTVSRLLFAACKFRNSFTSHRFWHDLQKERIYRENNKLANKRQLTVLGFRFWCRLMHIKPQTSIIWACHSYSIMQNFQNPSLLR